MYVTPHYANPSGRVWSRQRKLALLEISERLGLPIVEDDTACLVPLAEGAFASGRADGMKRMGVPLQRQVRNPKAASGEARSRSISK